MFKISEFSYTGSLNFELHDDIFFFFYQTFFSSGIFVPNLRHSSLNRVHSYKGGSMKILFSLFNFSQEERSRVDNKKIKKSDDSPAIFRVSRKNFREILLGVTNLLKLVGFVGKFKKKWTHQISRWRMSALVSSISLK